jgi:Putative phage metallopeptidase
VSAPRHESEPDRHDGLILRWQEPHDPLPVQRVRPLRPTQRLGPLDVAPPWHDTGPAEQPFDFSGRVRRVLENIVCRVPELAHVAVARILLSFTQARSPRVHGLQARMTPLRFPRGELIRQRRGVTYQVQRYFVGEHEFLYLLTFCLPRFLDQDFDQKLVTLLHELYHVSPAFDGDLRRHAGRYQLHTRRHCDYDRHMAGLARAYLASRPDPSLHAFLRLSFAQLQHRHGAVAGTVVPRPKIIPLLGAAARNSTPGPPRGVRLS